MSSIDKHYRENFSHLTKRARNMVPNKCGFLAEDAVQEAYTRVLLYSKYSPKKDFNKYFSRILRNVCNDMYTLDKVQGSIVEAPSAKEEALYLREIALLFEEATKTGEARTELTRHIISTDEQTQTILNMFRNGIGIPDIAVYVGRHRNSVHRTIKRFVEGTKT